MSALSFASARKGYQSEERVFEYRLTCEEPLVAGEGINQANEAKMMDAMVLPNALFVLVLPDSVIEDFRRGGPIESITFSGHLVNERGKAALNTKKKVPKVQIKSPICTIQQNGSRITLHAPVSGKVLELNQRLHSSPDLLLSGFEGYTAVIQPDDKIAKIIKLQN